MSLRLLFDAASSHCNRQILRGFFHTHRRNIAQCFRSVRRLHFPQPPSPPPPFPPPSSPHVLSSDFRSRPPLLLAGLPAAPCCLTLAISHSLPSVLPTGLPKPVCFPASSPLRPVLRMPKCRPKCANTSARARLQLLENRATLHLRSKCEVLRCAMAQLAAVTPALPSPTFPAPPTFMPKFSNFTAPCASPKLLLLPPPQAPACTGSSPRPSLRRATGRGKAS